MKKVLSIAGSDSSGGAGIQADIKTITAHGMYAMTAITAVTVQNTLGVNGVQAMDPEIVAEQIDAVFEDIRPDAVKTGMLGNEDIAVAVVVALQRWRPAHLVVDPVMVSTSGCSLLEGDVKQVLFDTLFPLAELITPNIPEAESLIGGVIKDEMAMREAAREITRRGKCAVLLKGGHLADEALDVLVQQDGKEQIFRAPKIESKDTHGTGCTLSAAIACNLAGGMTMADAVGEAKRYISGAIGAAPGFGHGHGPVNHVWRMQESKG